MNKLTCLGVSIHRLCVLVILILLSTSSFAQDDTYTIIRKNVNPLAFTLDHNLSNTQDSLVLENKFLFKKVRFLNKTTEKVFNFKPAVTSAKIPLDELPLGTYTVMFYQIDKIIVFQIDRLLPFDYNPSLETDVATNELIDVKLELDIAKNELSDFNKESDVAMNKLSDIKLESNIVKADLKDIDLDIDTSNLSLAANGGEEDFEVFEASITMAYNITESDRSKVQSRADYRRTHLRPNGKPYSN